MRTLREVQIGDTVTVVKLYGAGAVKRRIMDMGITKGAQVFMRKAAPLEGPTEVKAQDYELNLHKADTKLIEVD